MNPNIPTTEAVVIGLNLLCVLASVVVNWMAAVRGPVAMRVLRAAITTVAALYVAGYSWLLFTDVQVVKWSSVMRGLSLVAWVVVWILPAVVSLRAQRELLRAIAERQEQGS